MRKAEKIIERFLRCDGCNPNQRGVYLALLKIAKPAPVSKIAQTSGLTAHKAAESLDALVAMRIIACPTGKPKKYTIVNPISAVELKKELDRIAPSVLKFRAKITPVADLLYRNVVAIGKAKEITVQLPHLKKPIVVLKGVFNPKLTNTTSFFISSLKVCPEDSVLDLGTGSGALGLFAAQAGARKVILTDSNPAAIACSKRNVLAHKASAKCLVKRGAMFEGVKDMRFEAILFNPPFLDGKPQSHFEESVFDYRRSYLRKVFSKIGRHLKPNGRLYLLYTNAPDRKGVSGEKLIATLVNKHGFSSQAISKLKRHGETYTLYQITKARPKPST